ncbi:MAG: hypothetical protein ABIU77_00190 [Ferruginibacter sp.]
METNNQKDSFEVLELVLKNLAEEQQKACRMLAEQAVVIELLGNKLDIFAEHIQQIKTAAPQVNLQPIEELIRRDIVSREVREREHPRKTIRQLQIILFPPQDARLFYKIVFGRWLIWLTAMLAITNLYKWGMHYTDVHQQDNPPQLQHQRNTKPVKPENGPPNKIRKRNL